MVTRAKNWIVYRTERASAQGWEERLLMPRGSLTDILWEHRTNSNKLPKVGDRVQRFENLEDPGREHPNLAKIRVVGAGKLPSVKQGSFPAPTTITRNGMLPPGNGATHAKTDDWIVTEVHEFASPTTDMRVVICLCEYSPIKAEWREMKRGKPVDEMLEAWKVEQRLM